MDLRAETPSSQALFNTYEAKVLKRKTCTPCLVTVVINLHVVIGVVGNGKIKKDNNWL